MTGNTHGANHLETLTRVIDDLQKEHTRFEERIIRLAAIPSESAMLANLTHQKDYLELLIRRYRSWLP